MDGWLLCTGVKLRVTDLTDAGLRLPDTAIESVSLEALTILNSGPAHATGLGLLDIALRMPSL